jgi:predicted nucleic acid-binding protein
MPYLLDTNLLVRIANASDKHHVTANKAIEKLFKQNERLCIAPQVLTEFWNVASRPVNVNGLGLRLDEVLLHIAAFEGQFELLPETPALFSMLVTIATAAQVTGKQIHDARPVAICHLHGIPSILSFNARHFARFTAIPSGLNVVEPAAIVAGLP